jgi:site-specific recombinase XerD
MLERYFVLPDTIDRIRGSWIGQPIEKYVAWLAEKGYAARSIYRRVPTVKRFGEFAQHQGITTFQELPDQIEAFIVSELTKRGKHQTEQVRKCMAKETRTYIEQMLCLTIPGFTGRGRPRHPENYFQNQAPDFFAFLREECGLRDTTIRIYSHNLRLFAVYLHKIGLDDLQHLSPPVFSGFITKLAQQQASTSSLQSVCGVLRVFVRYLYRLGLLTKDISQCIEAPRTYRLAKIPRSITWDEVRRMFEAVDRRTRDGKRDYAILMLLVTYGMRSREVAALTLDDIDWQNERLRVRERKAGHSTAYPLSPVVGEAILEYLRRGRPETTDRHIFFRTVAPCVPLTYCAISGRASHYMHKAGIAVSRAGSHTLRHTCVQRLVEAKFSLKMIGDYVGHRSAASTEVYTKVDIETLREVAYGDGEEIA